MGNGPVTSDGVESDLKAAREIAWQWFEYHAGQRLSVFRFYLIMVAFLSTGYVTAYVADRGGIAAVLAVILMLTTFAFYRLDIRSKILVNIGEEYLSVELERIRNSIGRSEILLTKEADERKQPYFSSFRQMILFIFIVVGSISFLAVIIAIVGMLDDSHAVRAAG